MNLSIIDRLTQLFTRSWGSPAFLVRSPGRINLIGEHLDYNMGFVMPAAIDKAIYLAMTPRADDTIRLMAGDLQQTHTASLHQLSPVPLQWPDYLMGVADQFLKAGYPIKGFDVALMGDVPLGAGLSSSAAVECAMAFSLNYAFDLGLDKLTMVQLAQKAENQFVGVQCGIMDQFASMFGKQEQVIRLDCRSLAYTYLPFDTAGVDLVLLDTGVKHSLASSEYNLRRQECEAGVRLLQERYPSVHSLRDASVELVAENLKTADPVIYRRCRYITEEIQRVLSASEDLQKGSMQAFGRKMFQTHEGLSKDYQVSCAEADFLVEKVAGITGVWGARMMGGGFGGCTLNLLEKGRAEELIATLQPAYQEKFGKILQAYPVNIDEGTSLIS
ncbi:MAG TPA: galactokinase [Sediminibacterium sp.]|nr:galactokinase [Sediminibacterium sp.]